MLFCHRRAACYPGSTTIAAAAPPSRGQMPVRGDRLCRSRGSSESESIPSAARGTPAATPSRRSCSSSTSSAMRTRSGTASCPPSWSRRLAWPSPTVPRRPSASTRPDIVLRLEEGSMAERPPVTDWATDFDHTDPRWIEDPYPIWDDLRQRCPVAHTERYSGVYLPTRYEDIKAITYDTEHF